FVTHQAPAKRGAVEELIVAIEGVAFGLVRTPGEGAFGRVAQVGALADRVDGAASRAACANRRVRAFGDFYRFYGEDLAGLRAGVAHAIEVHRALAVEAANERPVTRRVAAFASAHGDPRHGAQSVLQVQRVGVLDDLLRDHGDRAG